MKMRGFAISLYTPSTNTMSGIEHWCAGGDGRGGDVANFRGDACLPCPADWDWDEITSSSFPPRG